MAKIKSSGSSVMTPKKGRPGVHAKTKTSRSKNATNYKKRYRGQGK
jgi:hypothetical protein